MSTLREQLEEAAGIEPEDSEESQEQISQDSTVESENTSATVDEAVGEIETTEEIPEVVQSIEPPTSWRSDEKEAFKALPPNLQEVVARRESERDSFLHQTRQKYSGLDKVFEPHVNDWERAGLSPDRVVSQLLAWDRHLRERPFDAIQELAAKSGIDLAQFAKVQEAQGPQDPYLRHALTELQQLKAEKEQEAVQREQQFHQGLSSEIERFRSSAKDGRALYPHFDSVREDMAVLVPLVQAANPSASTQEVLQEAYSRAVRANPTTFEAYTKEIEARREQENRKRFAQKKIAGSSISGSPEGGKFDAPMTLREQLEAAAAGRL